MKIAAFSSVLILSLLSFGPGSSLAHADETAGGSQPPAAALEGSTALDGSTALEGKGAPAAAKAIVGKWKKVGTEGVVEVSESGGVFTGKLIKSEKDKELLGETLFRELTFDAEKGLYEGKIYSPERKRQYKATYTVVGDKLTLTVKGRVVEWTRL